MEDGEHMARVALCVAIAGSVTVGFLLGCAEVGIFMKGANLHPTPRINAFTVGMGMTPVPALAWIAWLWTCRCTKGSLNVAARVIISAALVAGAGWCVMMALFAALFVG
jgi:hypothetical protein